jgi:hypothetical protein
MQDATPTTHTHRETPRLITHGRFFSSSFLFSFGVKTAGQGEDQKKQSLPPPENKNFFLRGEYTHTHTYKVERTTTTTAGEGAG